MGRRRLILDAAKIQALAAADWNIRQIAYEMGCSHDVLERHYREDMERGWAKGVGQLKLKAHKEALDGNTEMLKLCLKQRAGYTEKTNVQISGDPINPIQILHTTLSLEQLDERMKQIDEEIKLLESGQISDDAILIEDYKEIKETEEHGSDRETEAREADTNGAEETNQESDAH